MLLGILCGGRYNNFQIIHKVRCDPLKNKSSRRVTYFVTSIYFLNDRSVYVLPTDWFLKQFRLQCIKTKETGLHKIIIQT
jgi:hypothetical protein